MSSMSLLGYGDYEGGVRRPPPGSIAPMILERSMHQGFLSNTYLVADEPGGTAVMIDAGGPVAPLLEKIDEHELTLSHVLLTHHHGDHVADLPAVLDRHPDVRVLTHPLEKVEGVSGSVGPGQAVQTGRLAIKAIHTPGHTAGMLSFFVIG